MMINPFSFRGRATRAGYWHTQALIALSSALFIGAAVTLITNGAPRWLSGLSLAPVLGLIWISLAVTVRRLHDRGKRAWWLFPFVVLPILPQIAFDELERRGVLYANFELLTVMYASALIGFALGIWGFIEFGFVRGQREGNQYGPPPA